MTDHELLKRLYALIVTCNFIEGDEASIRDMVLRYQNPPLTLYRRASMQMTGKQCQALNDLLKQVQAHLMPETVTEENLEPA